MQSVTLIIDKRRELSTKYKKLLSNQNNEVIVSKNFISAIKIIQDKEPDIIIISDSIDSDLSDYCKKIRALTYNMRPVIIAISKSAELDDKLLALENGADDFISEPVNPKEFIMRIKAHLRRELESNMDIKHFLPTLNYSMRVLKRVISQKTLKAVMLISIENFDSYKENYTELASDKLLQTYCAIIQSAITENDYLGLISENKLLLITDTIKCEQLANFLTFAFDSVASKFYSPQDKKRGFMLMQGDEYAGKRANFVHTTIGIVTNEFVRYTDTAQLLTTLTQIHNMADIPDKSNYLIERPKISAEDSVQNEVNKKIVIIEEDDALRLLLKTIFNLQGYEIADSYKDSPALVILDASEIGFELCKQIKKHDSRIKLVVTSISHDKETVLSAGADLYIPKPYEISSLIKWVEELLA